MNWEPKLGAPLSDKETRILMILLTEGCAGKEIAYRLGITLKTEKVYVHRIHKKLGVSSSMELMARSINHYRARLAELETI